jgi:DNA-binding response OmpR family regulator
MGEGHRAVVTLSLWHASCPSLPRGADCTMGSAGRGVGRTEACVVVVDDEPDVLELVCDVLQESGLEVIPVAHPGRMRQCGDDCKPDLVVLDLMLPGKTGIQLARELQSDGMAGTPMIAMSASPAMLKAASDSRLFEETLSKPFDLTDLLEVVGRHLRFRAS